MVSSSSWKTNNRLWITRVKRGVPRKRLAAFLGHETTSQLCRWEDGSQIPTLGNALLLGYLLDSRIEDLFVDLRNDLVRQVEMRRGEETEENGGLPEDGIAMPEGSNRIKDESKINT